MSDANFEVNDYEFRNDFTICGKIIYKRAIKNGNMFAISIGRRLKTPRLNETTGKMETMQFRTVDVDFEGAVGKTYDKMYEVGDFVVVSGVVQKTRNNYLARNMVKLIGLSMSPKIVGNHENRDKNYVILRGRVDYSVALNNNYIICDLYTNIDKKFKNPNTENTDVPYFTDSFVSYTPIGINRPEGDAKEAVKELTKGTWLDVSGFIDVRKIQLSDDGIVTETRVICQDVSIIGQTQVNN